MGWTQTSECPMGVDVAQRKKEKKKNHILFDAAFPLGRQSMSLSLGLRRVSQSFNTLLRHRSLAHRPFTTKSPTGRVLFLAHSTPPIEHCFYSAKIQKDGTLGPATRLPPVPFELYKEYEDDARSITVIFNGSFLLLYGRGNPFCDPVPSRGVKVHLYNPDTGEDSRLPDVPYEPPSCDPVSYFGFDPLSNDQKVLFVQRERGVWHSQNPVKRLFWVFARSSGSWRRIHPFLPEQNFRFPTDLKKVVFAGGSIYFNYESDQFGDPFEKYILAFDMAEEQFRKIPYPDPFFPAKLIECGGFLGLIQDFELELGSDDLQYDKLQIWILEDCDNQKWVHKKIQFPFDWMRYKDVLAFNYNTGDMFLCSRMPPELRIRLQERECLLCYNTKTGYFRGAELTGFPHWYYTPQEDIFNARNWAEFIKLNSVEDSNRWGYGYHGIYVAGVTFDDEMERQKSFEQVKQR